MHHTFRCRQKYRLFLLFIILGVAKYPIPPLVDHSFPPFQTQSWFPDFRGLDQAAFDHHVGLFPTLCGELTGGQLTVTIPQSAEKKFVPHWGLWPLAAPGSEIKIVGCSMMFHSSLDALLVNFTKALGNVEFISLPTTKLTRGLLTRG